jgi:hypothetical protein
MAGVSAVQVLQGGAAGGAQDVGGSELECSVAVRPFLNDLEHGTRVYLTPGRFVLRSVAASVSVTPGASGWTLHGARSGGLTVDYEVFDTLRSTVVVHDRATLTCESEGVSAAPAPTQLIVQTDPNADTSNAANQLIAPAVVGPRPQPFASIHGSIEIGTLGYLGLEHLRLRSGGVTVHGADLALRDTWLAGTGGFGVVGELPFAMVALRAHSAFGDHAAMLEARGTLAAGARIGGAFWYVGATASAWQAWIFGIGQQTWDTGTTTAFGLEAGVRLHTSTRWVPSLGRFRLGETAVALSVPIAGDGAWSLTWEGSWGTGR